MGFKLGESLITFLAKALVICFEPVGLLLELVYDFTYSIKGCSSSEDFQGDAGLYCSVESDRVFGHDLVFGASQGLEEGPEGDPYDAIWEDDPVIVSLIEVDDTLFRAVETHR